jgi:hypothetical protein
MQWGIYVLGPINPSTHRTWNWHILLATNIYATKWAKAKAFKNNNITTNARFLYEHIITKFGCPMELINDQGSHFINETIKIFIVEFMINHKKATAYYPQGCGQVENTNKVLEGILTKLIDSHHMNWDVKLPTALWAYRIFYKISTKHIPFELIYGF